MLCEAELVWVMAPWHVGTSVVGNQPNEDGGLVGILLHVVGCFGLLSAGASAVGTWTSTTVSAGETATLLGGWAAHHSKAHNLVKELMCLWS